MAMRFLGYQWSEYNPGWALIDIEGDEDWENIGSEEYPIAYASMIFEGNDTTGYYRYESVSGYGYFADNLKTVQVLIPYLMNQDGVYKLTSSQGSIELTVRGEEILVEGPLILSMTANAHVDSSGGAHIELWSSIGWKTGEWSMEILTGDVPSLGFMDLFRLWDRAGVGTIDGNYLQIYIEKLRAGEFTLFFEHGSKVFDLGDMESEATAELVAFNNFGSQVYIWNERVVGHHEIGWTIPKCFVYLGESVDAYAGRITAQLQVGKEVHAVVKGNAIDRIQGEYQTQNDSGGTRTHYTNWSIPGIMLSEFFWLKPPTEPTTYKLVMRATKRGGGSSKMLSFTVVMDLDRIYSPGPSTSYDMSEVVQVRMSMGLGEAVYEYDPDRESGRA